MEIREITNKIEKSFDGNGLLVFGGGFIILFVIAYLMQSKNTESEPIKITGAYASYPDTVTNADEIIGTLEDYVDTKTGEITNEIGNVREDISEIMDKIPESNDFDKYHGQPIRKAQPIETNTNIRDLVDGISSMNNIATSLNGNVHIAEYDAV